MAFKTGEKANGAGDGAGGLDSKAPDGAGTASAEAGSGAAVAPAKRTLELSRDDFRKIGDKQRNRRANAIGKIVSLLARAPTYQDMPLKDLEWFLMPAIAAGQYMIGETKPSAERRGGVAAMLLWARVSPEVDKRLFAFGRATWSLRSKTFKRTERSSAPERPCLHLSRCSEPDSSRAANLCQGGSCQRKVRIAPCYDRAAYRCAAQIGDRPGL